MQHIIIGTAGHIDHGKTALIKALTGIDTDRLKAEKERGITIDIGFAHLKISDEIIGGIIDVPGHERYIKNMLAGSSGLDMALLIVAADEGVMPQTIEHLAILDSLGLQYGIIVISKIDKVDEDLLALVEEEISELAQQTFLADAPICRVSAKTLQGMADLQQVIAQIAERIQPPERNTAFRLWVDRKFIVKGHGLVVTGSVLSGEIAAGDTVTLYPQETAVRIRGIECHHDKVVSVQAGQRAALNITGADLDQIKRGSFLSTQDCALVSSCWDGYISSAAIKKGMRVRIHIGTGEFLARVYPYKIPGNLVKLKFEQPVAASMGDKGIIRQYSPSMLLGGLTLVSPWKKGKEHLKIRSEWAVAVAARDEQQLLCKMIADMEFASSRAIWRYFAYQNQAVVEKRLEILVLQGSIVQMGEYYLESSFLEKLNERIVLLLDDNYVKFKTGVNSNIVRRQLQIPEVCFADILKYWKDTNVVAAQGQEIFLYKHYTASQSEAQQITNRLLATVPQNQIINIDTNFLCNCLKIKEEQAKALHRKLINNGLLLAVNGVYLFPGNVAYVVETLKQYFTVHETITVSAAKEMFGCSRKSMLAVLEYLDQQKITKRENDVRCLGSAIK